ncbi:MAG: phosphate/phosphite/phosphonate ABC transporter substrate-binding protein [Planctomycetes bacterium]|nr:phosphate/phosphite/phosphonate ABC transporter substrate-binding protein [Planctomycetota bacterium]
MFVQPFIHWKIWLASFVILAFGATVAQAQPAKVSVLRIGATGTITGNADSAKEKAGHETLRKFIKEETSLTSEIVGQEKWQELTEKLAKGQYHLGVYQGFEFAWAQERNPNLKALAVGINSYRYPVACVMVRRDNPAKDFTSLKGQTLAVSTSGQDCLSLFVEQTCLADGKHTNEFFSKIASYENIEDTLDDIVDGKVSATVIDQAGLDGYKRRKPGRFNQLKEIARSGAFPPIVIAYCGSTLDDATLKLFKSCLLTAAQKEKGELLLTLSHLSAFQEVAAEFPTILAETRKAYPKDLRK